MTGYQQNESWTTTEYHDKTHAAKLSPWGSLREHNPSSSTNKKQDTRTEYITGVKLVLSLSSITVCYFLVMLDTTVLATAIAYVVDDFHSLLDVGWYISAYQISSASLVPLMGKFYLRLDTKRTWLVCLAGFAAGSAICGAAQSSTMLIVGRAVQGIGGSGLMSGALIILNACVHPDKQAALLAVLMAMGQLGLALGPLIGGALTDKTSWRWCFYINLPVAGVVALGLVFIHIPEHIAKPGWRTVLKNPVSEFDLPGAILFAPAAIQLLLALTYGGNQHPWNSSTVIGLFCGSGTTFIVWLIWNFYQGDNAMIPFSMLKKRAAWASCVSIFFLLSSIFTSTYYLPLFFQIIKGVSPLTSGVYVLPDTVTRMVFGLASGVIIQRLGIYFPFLLGGNVLNVIGTGLLGLLEPSTPTGQWVGFQILASAGRGPAWMIPFLLVQHVVPQVQVPAISSTIVFCVHLGPAVSMSIAATILSSSLRNTIPIYAPGIDPEVVIAAGATAARKAVPSEALEGVLFAYAKSIDRVFYFGCGVAFLAFLAAGFAGGVDIGKKGKSTAEKEVGENA